MVVLGKVNIYIFLMNDINVDCCFYQLCKKQNVQVLFWVNVLFSLSGVIEKISFFFLEKEEKRRWEKGKEKEGKGKIVD